jgi:hypothetical protein
MCCSNGSCGSVHTLGGCTNVFITISRYCDSSFIRFSGCKIAPIPVVTGCIGLSKNYKIMLIVIITRGVLGKGFYILRRTSSFLISIPSFIKFRIFIFTLYNKTATCFIG